MNLIEINERQKNAITHRNKSIIVNRKSMGIIENQMKSMIFKTIEKLFPLGTQKETQQARSLQ